MTLYKQTLLSLSLLLLLILITVLALNFKSAKENVSESLHEHAKNTASSLSISLAGANKDVPMMSRMIDSNFDSGNYLLISLIDMEHTIIHERNLESAQPPVPLWFSRLVTLEAPKASAKVFDEQTQIGSLHVQSDVTPAYIQLYSVFNSLLIFFAILGSAGLVVLNLSLVALLRPLKGVQKQAEALVREEFILQETTPSTQEFKDLVLGMNSMVLKAKSMFEKSHQALMSEKELAYIHSATKLKKRKYLYENAPKYLQDETTSKDGIFIMLALSGMNEANKEIGHKEVDAFIVHFAKILTDSVETKEEAIVARMNGVEFGIFMPDTLEKEAKEIAQKIKDATQKLIKESNLQEENTYLSLGIFAYTSMQNINELLCFSDNALTMAKASDTHIYYQSAHEASLVMGKDAWRAIIKEVLEKKSFSFTPEIIIDTQHQKLSHNLLSFTLTPDKKSYTDKEFMAVAKERGVSHRVYTTVLEMLFKDVALRYSHCSLRLPYEYLVHEHTYDALVSLLSQNSRKLPRKLMLEMPYHFFQTKKLQAKAYKALLEKYRIQIGIYEFATQSHDFEYLKELKVLHITAQADYFLSQDEKSLSNLKALQIPENSLFIASGVLDLETLEKLQERDIRIIKGNITQELEIIA